MKKIKLLLVALFTMIIVAGIYFSIQFFTKNQITKELNTEARKNAGGQFIQLTDGIAATLAGEGALVNQHT